MSDYKAPFQFAWCGPTRTWLVIDSEGKTVDRDDVAAMLNELAALQAQIAQSEAVADASTHAAIATAEELAAIKAQRCEAKITTRCPSCGHATIMVTDSGDLVCSLIGCQDPTAINRQSAQRCETCAFKEEKLSAALNGQILCGRTRTVETLPHGCTAHQPKEQA